MIAEVYFMDFRATPTENLPQKFERLLKRAGIEDVVREGDLTAIKIHFGEPGNLAYIRPNYVRRLVEILKKLKTIPFLTDANTLYRGRRANAPEHIEAAIENGFAFPVVNAPIVIADGLRGMDEVEVEINLEYVKKAKIGAAAYYADSIIVMTHFKGHEATGFGGTIKNIGMGFASRAGKLDQHSTSKPRVEKDKCVGCSSCVKYCPANAVKLVDRKAQINYEICIGCGQCIAVCQFGAMVPNWDASTDLLSRKMAEYAYAVLKDKRDRALYVSFIMDVSPNCDCWNVNDAPIVPNIGILASRDPVAIDQASADLVNQAPINPYGSLDVPHSDDKFMSVHPSVDWRIQLEHAEKIGLGARKYKLIKI